jgi:cytosine/adenosine deaminase-related metal-dependent hydrolase
MWNPLSKLTGMISGHGGFVNAHAHFDRAYSVSIEDFTNTQGNINSQLQEKWKLVDRIKVTK